MCLFFIALGLCCSAWAFSAVAGDGGSLVGASHRGGFSCCGAQAQGLWASVVAPCRLRGLWFPGSRAWGLQELWCPGSVVVARWP